MKKFLCIIIGGKPYLRAVNPFVKPSQLNGDEPITEILKNSRNLLEYAKFEVYALDQTLEPFKEGIEGKYYDEFYNLVKE